MKVIQIMPEFGLAGAETMCENLSVELKRRGINVLVVSLYNQETAITDRLKSNGIQVVYLNKKPGLDFRLIPKLFKLFKKERPDVIHTHRYVMQYAIPAAVLARVKRRVHTVHNVATKETTATAQKLNNLFYHLFGVIPVALSQEVQLTIKNRYNISLEKIPVIYNGVDLDKCKTKLDYSIDGNIQFLHIGRFSEQKNQRLLLEAFSIVHKKMPETNLMLIGGGELEKQMKSLANKLSLSDSVIFAGQKENVYPFLNKADVFILSSNYEGMPMTLIEAMGTALPIVTTNVGGIPTMLENNRDGLVVENSVEIVANAMLKMADIDLRAKLGLCAMEKARRLFSAQVMCEKYLSLYFE